MDTATRTQAQEAIANLTMMDELAENFTFGDFIDEAIPTAELIEKLIASLENEDLKFEGAQSAEFLQFMASEPDRFSMGEFTRNLMEAANLISRMAQL